MKTSLLIGLGMLAVAGSAQADSSYCLPTAAGRDRIDKVGSVCPDGYFATGKCCESLHDDTRKAVPKIEGSACPAGTFTSNTNYCIRF